MYTIRVVEERDREWVQDVINSNWGGSFIVVHEEIYYPDQLPGLIAEDQDRGPIGLVTYKISNAGCEIITLNSLVDNRGVGAALIEAVTEKALRAGCHYLCLTTTNDNQQAIDFYNNRGFKLKEIRKGAVEKARVIKPSIPPFSQTGTPIRDEWEFQKFISGKKEENHL